VGFFSILNSGLLSVCAKVFAVIDVKGRGSISRDQIPLALRMLNFNPVDSELENLLKLEPKGYISHITHKEMKVVFIACVYLNTKNCFKHFNI